VNSLGHGFQIGLAVDGDEARLRQLDTLIAEARRAERIEAERREAEARRQAEIEARKTFSLADLEEKRAALAAEIAVKQTHLRTTEETELLRRRADRLRDDVAEIESKLAITQSELAEIKARHRQKSGS
jgi:hypothetical protein